MKQRYHPNHPVKFQKVEELKSQSGFTMIELLTIIVVMGILCAIAMPNIESIVFGSSSNRAVLELISELQLARMKAIQIHGPVTVTFNSPAQNQYTVSWTDDIGGDREKTVQLDPRSGRVVFDGSPPGGVSPDGSFTFTALGFSDPSSVANVSYIYLVDIKNKRCFRIAATVSGGIDKHVWSNDIWSGPEFIHSEAP